MPSHLRAFTVLVALFVGAVFGVTTSVILDAPSPSSTPFSSTDTPPPTTSDPLSAAASPLSTPPTLTTTSLTASAPAPLLQDPKALTAALSAAPSAAPAPLPKDPTRHAHSPTTPAAPPTVKVVDSATAFGVRGRAPESPADTFPPDVGQVWAWVRVANDAPDATHVTLVWRHDGQERARVQLEVGAKAAGWRTWSSKRITQNQTGPWAVDVLDAQGHLLHTLRFTVAAPSALAL